MNQLALELPLDSEDATTLRQMYAMVERIHANQIALDDRLWRLSDVARYMQTSEANARYVMQNDGAPRPVQMPTSSTHVMPPRYYPDEVKAFVKKKGRNRQRG